MALQYSITDGQTTIQLTANGVVLENYFPAAGGDTVAESMDLLVYGANAAAVRDTAWAIERLLQRARQNQVAFTGQRVYLQAQIDGDTGAWRSEVTGGRLEPRGVSGWVQYRQRYSFVFERKNWWEGPETEVPVVAAGSKTTGGEVWASTNSARPLFVEAVDVTGNLPAPFRLELANSTGGNISLYQLILSQNVWSDPAYQYNNDFLILEGENADSGAAANDSNDANSRGGKYRTLSWSGATPSSGVNLFHWTVSASQLSRCGGRWFRGVMRVAQLVATSPVFASLRVMIPAGQPLTSLYEGLEVPLASGRAMHDLGALPLPPGSWTTNHQAVSIVLAVRSSSSVTLAVDALYMLPTDGFYRAVQFGYQLEPNDVIVIDGMEERTFGRDADTAEEWNIYTNWPGKPRLWPAQNQAFVFLWDRATGGMDIQNSTWTARMFYRPRRASL